MKCQTIVRGVKPTVQPTAHLAEYVFDADVVAALGNGSNKAGAEILDEFREKIRAHKRSAPIDEIPPKAKSPLAYMKEVSRG